jgi:hypothetical protein
MAGTAMPRCETASNAYIGRIVAQACNQPAPAALAEKVRRVAEAVAGGLRG